MTMTSDPREWLNERLAWAYIQASGKATHTNTCSTSVAPARQPGPCDCEAEDDATMAMDNWERIFAAKREYYASVRSENYADSLRLECLVGCSSTVEPESLKFSDVRSNRTTPAIYINADTGEQVTEDWWPEVTR